MPKGVQTEVSASVELRAALRRKLERRARAESLSVNQFILRAVERELAEAATGSARAVKAVPARRAPLTGKT